MSRALSANTGSKFSLSVTRPLYLVEFLLATPLRFSSREQISYNGLTWVAAGLKVNLAGASVSIYNDALAYSDDFLAGVSGSAANIWKLYGDGPFVFGDADLMFAGEIGAVGIGERIEVKLREAPTKKVPRLYVTPPTFNHLPADGLQILTPSGVFVLERK